MVPVMQLQLVLIMFFLGANAGNLNTTGVGNVFLGSDAGSINTTGSFNTFVGRNSGLANTTGIGNVFVGINTGANSSAALTGCVLIGNNTGINNTTDNRLMIDNTGKNTPLVDGVFDSDPLVATLTVNGKVTLGATGSTPTHVINSSTYEPAPAPPPANVIGYLNVVINGNPYIIPFYNPI